MLRSHICIRSVSNRLAMGVTKRRQHERGAFFSPPKFSRDRPHSPDPAHPLNVSEASSKLATIVSLTTLLYSSTAQAASLHAAESFVVSPNAPESALHALVLFSVLISALCILLSLMLRTDKDDASARLPIEQAKIRSYVDPSHSHGHLVQDPRLQALASSAAHTVVLVAHRARGASQSRSGSDVRADECEAQRGGSGSGSECVSAAFKPKSFRERVAMYAALLEAKEMLKVYHQFERDEKIHL